MRQELYVSFNDIKDLSPLLAHEASKLAGFLSMNCPEPVRERIAFMNSQVRVGLLSPIQSCMGDQIHSPLPKKIFLAALPAE